ncbi:hypothetical protein CHGG_06333 [Chaetomium globosum CBS 148.51]|uniref:DUF8035 domain-containing protein n=1 Tax=Chaetomium globosum (strain ATCC 6205 / CBS 148.51 / DSM 1962 / NBRC 6347 / NRRL 1970) TaxID=306901 RepID=Q2H4T2_CHAGB|nr:uncharacterized protein CHGG_06333 [Chaetomium globosum CBS 148.51]EAQ89714.1 hypothetical protein CHGG_06333 [Chaetomium globosum CBS 148.51]
MADPARYRYMDAASRRSPPLYNPARSSMPVTGGGYGSLYSGDLHGMSASHHEGLSRPADEYRTSAVPVGANTYAVRKEPLSRSTSVNDGTRVHRVLDQNAKRPIIVTTKHHPPAQRPGSPPRDPYRSSDEGQYYAQPASSIPRSRPAGYVPSSASMDDEEYRRLKERTHHDRLGNRGADPYRPARSGARRPAARASIGTIARPSASAQTSPAHSTRPTDECEVRRRQPGGLDKIGWTQAAGGIYNGAGSHMPLPPSTSTAPLLPDVRRVNLLEGSPREEHRGGPRPLSMIQDDPARISSHPDDYYIYDDPRDQNYFQDDRVTARGFGILVDPNDVDDHRRPPEKVYVDERRERREPQKRYEVHESKRRPDDDLEIIKHEYDDRDHRRYREHEYAVDEEIGRERRDRRSDDDEPDSKRDKVRDKAAAGVGVAAAAVGLKSAMKRRSDKDEDPSPPRRHAEEDLDRRRHDEADPRGRPSRKEALLDDEDFEIVEHPRDREKPKNLTVPEPEARESKKPDEAAAQPSRDRSSSVDGEAKPKPRRRLRASSFNPNDTAALAEMKARLAKLKDAEKADEKDASPAREHSPERKPPPTEKRENDPEASATTPKDDGDATGPPSRDERQVRLVPPPKDATVDKKPIKGILKQPKVQFPEEPNPVREGVAPHKDDKSKNNVPTGARWTKISRKMVNPEALKIGKERFEVRDDFVIVLRVLSKEEIQAYAAATATLRERRKKEYDEARGEAEYDEDRDRGRETEDDDKKKRHRQHEREKDDERRGKDKEREKDTRHRRHRIEDSDSRRRP